MPPPPPIGQQLPFLFDLDLNVLYAQGRLDLRKGCSFFLCTTAQRSREGPKKRKERIILKPQASLLSSIIPKRGKANVFKLCSKAQPVMASCAISAFADRAGVLRRSVHLHSRRRTPPGDFCWSYQLRLSLWTGIAVVTRTVCPR